LQRRFDVGAEPTGDFMDQSRAISGDEFERRFAINTDDLCHHFPSLIDPMRRP
jgi:hypothetical protein